MPDKEAQKKALLDKLERSKYITNQRIRKAMEIVPREAFIPEERCKNAYEDHPLSIGYGQTISAPHMNAMMCSGLDLDNLDSPIKLLEIGTGSGYHATLCAEILKQVQPGSKVYTVERIKDLADRARKIINQLGYGETITVIHSDGTLGYSEAAPYDRILVTAAGPRVPEALASQLTDNGGIMLIPLGGRRGFQRLVKVIKQEGKLKEKRVCGVAFVPLIGKDGFAE